MSGNPHRITSGINGSPERNLSLPADVSFAPPEEKKVDHGRNYRRCVQERAAPRRRRLPRRKTQEAGKQSKRPRCAASDAKKAAVFQEAPSDNAVLLLKNAAEPSS